MDDDRRKPIRRTHVDSEMGRQAVAFRGAALPSNSSDVPSGVNHHAENLALFPFNFGWKIDNETLVLTFFDQDRALKALNCLQELKHMNLPVKAVADDPD